MKKKELKEVTDQEIRDLVIARLRSLSSDRKISMGSDGEYSKEDLVQSVKSHDEVGDKIIAMQLNYLESLKSGTFFDN